MKYWIENFLWMEKKIQKEWAKYTDYYKFAEQDVKRITLIETH